MLALQNDFLFDSDNQFTGGGSIHMHSGIFDRLAEVHGTPAFGKVLAGLVLPHRAELSYREGWLIGHSEQTPAHITADRLIKNDFPYVGLTAWGNIYTAFNNRNLYSVELLLGWVGPLAGGEQVQSTIHSVIGGTEPEGWDNQLDNEPVVNLYYTFQHKLWRRQHVDLAASATGALGNYSTYGQIGMIARLGQLPQGFASLPDPLGRGIDYYAIQTPQDRGYFYVTLAIRGTAFAYSMERQGNLLRTDNDWTENNTLDMNRVVGQFIGGLHYVRPHWGLHFNVWMTTNTVDPDDLADDSEARNNFAEIRFVWRFS